LASSEGGEKARPATREVIFVEILRDIEAQRMVPGQRIAETDLVERFGVGRNAVREGIQLLAERGVVELSPNKSAQIRRLTLEDANGVMDLSAVLNGLLARAAATHYTDADQAVLDQAFAELEAALPREQEFARARRHFSVVLLRLSQNKELQRIFPMVGIAIFNAQFRSHEVNELQLAGLRRILQAVKASNKLAAEKAGRSFIESQRQTIAAFF
jgi:DNA-binding GntR family transcriptional regulator